MPYVKLALLAVMGIFIFPLALGDNITIHNIGQSGFEETNLEFTSLRTVVLLVNFSDGADDCRYINHDNASDLPSFINRNWTFWESCQIQKFWELSIGDGPKTVYYQVNYSGIFTISNDSIFYNHTGAGLDVTPPSAPTISDGDFSNADTMYTVSWSGAYDRESQILGIPLWYNFTVKVTSAGGGSRIDATGSTEASSLQLLGRNYEHGDNITINVTVINSAGLSNATVSDGLIIDVIPPDPPGILKQQFRNKSTGILENIVGGRWISTDELFFEWSAADPASGGTPSGIGAYSYHLSTEEGKEVDTTPEGDIADLAGEINHSFIQLKSGINYFAVRAKDSAGNWGGTTKVTVLIDNTPPQRPNILSETFDNNDKSIVYTWSASTDISGIHHYKVNISDQEGNPVASFKVNDTTGKFNNTGTQTYTVIVGAMNGVGLWRWSNEEESVSDVTPPSIEMPISGSERFVTAKPVIGINTNETASCRYRVDSSAYTPFTYTNSTYHEAKITLSSPTATLQVNCSDMFNNFLDTTKILQVDETLNKGTAAIPASLSAYEGTKVEVPANVTDSTGSFNLSGFTKSAFSLELTKAGQSIPTDFFVSERGNGRYSIFFEAPEETGTYKLSIGVGDVPTIRNLEVLPLQQTIQFVNDDAANPNLLHHIVYVEGGNSRYGFATVSNNGVSMDLFDMNVSSSLDNPIFTFFSSKKGNLLKRDALISKAQFLELTTPSFGYPLHDSYLLRTVLQYKNIALMTEKSRKLSSGTYNILLKNIRSKTGMKSVYVTTHISKEDVEVMYSG